MGRADDVSGSSGKNCIIYPSPCDADRYRRLLGTSSVSSLCLTRKGAIACFCPSPPNCLQWSEGWESDVAQGEFITQVRSSLEKPAPRVGNSANLEISGFSYWFFLQCGWKWKDSWRSQEWINHIPPGCWGGDKSAKKAVRKKKNPPYQILAAAAETPSLAFQSFITLWELLPPNQGFYEYLPSFSRYKNVLLTTRNF